MKRIMIVEDEVILTMAIKRTLEDAGFDTISPVLSGEDAIEQARSEKPDCIIMDVTLQGEIDGIEATNTISNDSDAPIIVTTAHSDEGMLQRIKDSKCSDYLLKPINFHEMVELVKKHTNLEN